MKKIILISGLILLILYTANTQNYATVSQGYYIFPEYRGKEFYFSAYIKLGKKSEGTAHLWFRVDKNDSTKGFFENMDKNPIKENEWKKYEIQGKIDSNAAFIYFGCYLKGIGKLWADEFSLEIKDSMGIRKPFDIKNEGFEEMTMNYSVGWMANSEDYYYICDSVKPFKGKYSMRIESKAAEQILMPVYIKDGPVIKLPLPKYTGNVSVETALYCRRSVRKYDNDSITLEQVSQMLWAAYGVTDSTTFAGISLRTAPSAGACYPLEIYFVAGKVKGIKTGLYKYDPLTNSLKLLIDGDIRPQLKDVAFKQGFVKDAPASIIWTAVFEKTTKKFKDRGKERYVCMDLGHSGENVYLQAEALNFGTCAVAAFDDNEMIKLLNLPKEETPLYMMPFGKLTKEEIDKRKEKLKK